MDWREIGTAKTAKEANRMCEKHRRKTGEATYYTLEGGVYHIYAMKYR